MVSCEMRARSAASALAFDGRVSRMSRAALQAVWGTMRAIWRARASRLQNPCRGYRDHERLAGIDWAY